MPVVEFQVTGTWTGPGAGGSDNCTTNDSGQCTVRREGMRKRDGSVQYEVTDPSDPSAGNHDPDGDSDGTTITVLKP